jgi:hypothetical protein
VRRILNRFAQGFRLDVDRVWMPEAEMAVTWDGHPCTWQAPTVGLRGKADLALLLDRQTAHVWDWKSGWGMITERDLETDLQARTYGMLIHLLNTVITEVVVSFYYVRWGITRTATFGPQSHERTWAEWQAYSQSVEHMLDAPNDNKVWRPTPGARCATCAVRTRCPVTKLVPEIAVVDDVTLHQAAELYVTHTAAAEAYRERIRAYLDQTGQPPVAMVGGALGYWKEESWRYDADTVRRLAAAHGLDPGQLMRVDPEAVKKAMRRDTACAAEVEASREDAGRIVFKVKRTN